MNETLLNKARLNVVSLNKVLINGAVERHGSSAGGGGAPSKYIRFADPAVEAVLMANGVSSDGIGITMEDAAAVTSIGTWFKGNTDITSFDEFEYFTGVTFLGTHQTSAGYGAFDGCTNLEYLTLPPSCVDLRVQALANCTSLKRVNGFEHVKTIRNRMATNALLSQDLNLASVEGEIGYAAFAYTGITSISSLGKCTSLAHSNSSGSGVFDKCKSLKSVVIPESLTYIGGCAFMDDDALTSVIGLENVSVIKNRAFSGCTSLAYDVLNFRNLSVLEQDALYGIKVKKLNLSTLPSLPYVASARSTYGDRNVLEEVILSDAVSVITAHSFRQNTHLTTITMNRDRITSIEAAAFWDVPLSGDMSFASLTSLGGNAFRNTDIESFTAPNVAEIKYDTFNNCSNLKKVDFGAITAIGGRAFYGCTAMEKMTIRTTTPPALEDVNAFNNTNNCPIYVPDAAIEVYKTATNWSAYADRIHPLSELDGSPYITFADPEVERVLMENNVSSDGVGITMADAQAVTSIGAWFGGNTEIVSFDELQYFTGLTSIGSGYNNTQGFQGCESLQYVTLPTSVTEIKGYAFSGTSSLVEIKGADNVAILGGNAFASSGIQKLKLPSVQAIDGSFKGSTNLLLLECGEELTSIAIYTFWQMTTGLTTFICRATTPPTLASNNNLNFCSAIYVPDASVDAYKAATIWSTYADRIKPMSERPRAYDIDKMFQPATTADNSQIINTGIHLFNDFPTWTLRVNVSDINFSKMVRNGSAVTCGDESGSPYAGIHIAKDGNSSSIKMDINPNGSFIINTAAPPTIIIRRNGDILESSTDGGSTYVTRMTSIASVVASSPRLETIPMIVGGNYDGNGNVGRPFYGRVKVELWEEIIDFA